MTARATTTQETVNAHPFITLAHFIPFLTPEGLGFTSNPWADLHHANHTHTNQPRLHLALLSPVMVRSGNLNLEPRAVFPSR